MILKQNVTLFIRTQKGKQLLIDIDDIADVFESIYLQSYQRQKCF